MNNIFSIRPSKDLRTNYAQISKLTKEHPVAITVNGKEDTVIMSHEEFIYQQNHISALEERIALYEHLAMADDDIKLGRVEDADDVYEELRKEIAEIDYEL